MALCPRNKGEEKKGPRVELADIVFHLYNHFLEQHGIIVL